MEEARTTALNVVDEEVARTQKRLNAIGYDNVALKKEYTDQLKKLKETKKKVKDTTTWDSESPQNVLANTKAEIKIQRKNFRIARKNLHGFRGKMKNWSSEIKYGLKGMSRLEKVSKAAGFLSSAATATSKFIAGD